MPIALYCSNCYLNRFCSVFIRRPKSKLYPLHGSQKEKSGGSVEAWTPTYGSVEKRGHPLTLTYFSQGTGETWTPIFSPRVDGKEAWTPTSFPRKRGHPLLFPFAFSGIPESRKRGHPLTLTHLHLLTFPRGTGETWIPIFFPGYLLGVVCKGPKTPFQSVVFPCGDAQSLNKQLQSTGKGTSGIRGEQLSFVEPGDQKVMFCVNQQV
jgi:hypothetical protein